MRSSLLIGACLAAVAFAPVIAQAQTAPGLRLWSPPAHGAHDAVIFPFKFTWPHDRPAYDPTMLPLVENTAASYRLPATDTTFYTCMRVAESNYARVFRTGDFACVFDGYRFSSAQRMNEYITYKQTGETMMIHGFRRRGADYEPISETVRLTGIE